MARKIDQTMHDKYVETWEANVGQPVRFDGPDDKPFVGYSMLLAIAPTEKEARTVAGARDERSCPQHDLTAPVRQGPDPAGTECEAALGPLHAIMAGMEDAIKFGAGTPDQIAERLTALILITASATTSASCSRPVT